MCTAKSKPESGLCEISECIKLIIFIFSPSFLMQQNGAMEFCMPMKYLVFNKARQCLAFLNDRGCLMMAHIRVIVASHFKQFFMVG